MRCISTIPLQYLAKPFMRRSVCFPHVPHHVMSLVLHSMCLSAAFCLADMPLSRDGVGGELLLYANSLLLQWFVLPIKLSIHLFLLATSAREGKSSMRNTSLPYLHPMILVLAPPLCCLRQSASAGDLLLICNTFSSASGLCTTARNGCDASGLVCATDVNSSSSWLAFF